MRKECSFIKIEKGYILPHKEAANRTYGLGGVLREDGFFVDESAFMLPMNLGDDIDWGGSYDFARSECVFHDRVVIFGGFINNNEWGHFIADWSVRLWYPLLYDGQSDIVFCCRADCELHGNIQRVLELAGISMERIKIIGKNDPIMQFRSIIIPDPALTKEGYCEEFKIPFQRAVDGFIYTNGKGSMFSGRVYLSRTAMRPCKEYGEKQLERSFSRMGYTVIHPEQMTAEEQLGYYCGCEAMASIEGSAAHNIVFCKQGTEQVILEKQRIQNIRQQMLNRIYENRTHYFTCYPRTCLREFGTEGPFLVGKKKDFLEFSKEKGSAADIFIGAIAYMRYMAMYCMKWLRKKISHGKAKIFG